MADLLEHTATFVKRETPKIAGSAGAFVALIVVLVVIIITACTAAFILLREERKTDEESLVNRTRQQVRARATQAYPQTTKKWYTGVLTSVGIRDQDPLAVSDKPRSSNHGWMQAKTDDDWESESDTELAAPRPQRPASASVQLREYDPSLQTKRSSTADSYPRSHRSRVDSYDSNISSRYSIGGVRGLSYQDAYGPTIHQPLPSIQSQLSYPGAMPSSPTSSYHQPNWLSSSPPRTTSPGAYDQQTRPEPIQRPSSTVSGPSSIRTFEGGTKFVEAL